MFFKCFIIRREQDSGQEPKLYPITILRTVLYGKCIKGVDTVKKLEPKHF